LAHKIKDLTNSNVLISKTRKKSHSKFANTNIYQLTVANMVKKTYSGPALRCFDNPRETDNLFVELGIYL